MCFLDVSYTQTLDKHVIVYLSMSMWEAATNTHALNLCKYHKKDVQTFNFYLHFTYDVNKQLTTGFFAKKSLWYCGAQMTSISPYTSIQMYEILPSLC